jgi:tripartite-type tricarboxylate transporter receptor subunit TctC
MPLRIYSMTRRRALAALSLPAVSGISPARSQAEFPSKPIRLIVPFPPGGTASLALNLISQQFQQNTGTTLVLDYKPGASGNIGVGAVLKSPPDGYTIGFSAMNAFAINPHMTKKLPYNVERDVQPITTIGSLPNLIMVHPELKATNLQELVALSKRSELSYALTAIGSSIHLSAEMVIAESGMKMLAIPYKGESPALQDVLSGRVPVMFGSLPGLVEHVRSGKMRAIAVTSGQRTPVLPDVPTLAESGLPGFNVRGIFVLFTARGVPQSALEWLNRELSRSIDSPEVREPLAKVGLEAKSSTVEATQAVIQSEDRRWGPLIKKLGITWD